MGAISWKRKCETKLSIRLASIFEATKCENASSGPGTNTCNGKVNKHKSWTQVHDMWIINLGQGFLTLNLTENNAIEQKYKPRAATELWKRMFWEMFLLKHTNGWLNKYREQGVFGLITEGEPESSGPFREQWHLEGTCTNGDTQKRKGIGNDHSINSKRNHSNELRKRSHRNRTNTWNIEDNRENRENHRGRNGQPRSEGVVVRRSQKQWESYKQKFG